MENVKTSHPLPHLSFFYLFTAITNAAVDLSPILLGILFTLVLLCSVIFAKLYCYRSTTTTTTNSLHNGDTKHIGSINYKHDAAKVSLKQRKSLIEMFMGNIEKLL
jgi:hypothetical protein